MEAGYPEREKFFAQRFIRLITKLCLAQEVGAIGCYLLTTVVCQEDACRYRKPVTYYDSQLMPLLGTRSSSQLSKIKRALVAKGWLHYEAGKKGIASRYWVIIPPEFQDVEDAPVCETEHDLVAYREANQKRIRSESEVNEKCIGSASEAHEVHSLPYTPFPIPSSPYPIGAESEIDAEVVASMANEFWFSIPGTYKPPLAEVGADFRAKLHFLRANGRDETEKIWACIRDPTRDKTEVRTINQMWKFWERCGIEEKGNGRNKRNADTAPGGGRIEGLEAPSL